MWLLTTSGFYSIVEKPWDRQQNTLTVRARVLEDLEALKRQYLPELGPIHEDPKADYRYRAQAPREDVVEAIGRIATDIDYDNFKNAVAQAQGRERAHTYHQVWDVLYRLQGGST